MALQQPAQTLASHLISQTLGNIAAMENLSLITQEDAGAIRARLPNPYAIFPHLASGVANPSTPVPGGLPNPVAPGPNNFAPNAAPRNDVPPNAAPPNAAPPNNYGAPAPPYTSPPPPGPAPSRARALWDYNGTDAGDLQFRTGEIIIIDEEVNAEWFRGRVEGRGPEKGGAGLFPSNYVEKLNGGPGAFAPPPPPPQQQFYQPPPPQQTPAGPMQPPPQDDQKDGHKQNKFGKVGTQLGNSAMHGFGFGAGASVASNIVNSIF